MLIKKLLTRGYTLTFGRKGNSIGSQKTKTKTKNVGLSLIYPGSITTLTFLNLINILFIKKINFKLQKYNIGKLLKQELIK